MSMRCCSGSYPPRCTYSKRPWAEIVSGASNRASVRDQADPGEDLIRLDDDMVAAVDPLDPRRTISKRRFDAGLPQIGRFEHVRVRRENQGQHRHLLSDLIASSTFDNQPIAVKAGAVSDPCPAAVKVRLRVHLGQASCHANGRNRRDGAVPRGAAPTERACPFGRPTRHRRARGAAPRTALSSSR